MRTSFVRAGVVKELRALLVPWLLLLSAVVLAGITPDAPLAPITVVGAIALGAWSIGHEYSHRTLPLLLSQPVGRRTMAAVKAACLIPLLFIICAAAMALGAVPGERKVIGLGTAAALSLAPWLTMVSRSARGGIFFTLAVGLLWLIGGMWAGETIAARDPDRWADPRALAEAIVTAGFVTIFAVTVSLAWRRFQSLGAVDEQIDHLTLPDVWQSRRRVAGATVRPRHPLVALVRKELGLQIPVFVLSSVYLSSWITGWLLQPATRESLVMVATLLHGGLVPLLAGSMASAEERRMGTLGTQLLQPVAANVQWLVKAAVATSIALALAVGLPALLQVVDASVFTDRGLRQLVLGYGFYQLRTVASMVAVIAVLATLSLYVSSLARNSLHALLASLVAGVVLWGALANAQGLAMSAQRRLYRQVAQNPLYQQSQDEWQSLRQRGGPLEAPEFPAWRAMSREVEKYTRDVRQASDALVLATALLVGAGGVWLLLRFGSENHRFADHRPRRIARQVMLILLVPVVGSLLFNGLPALALGG